MFVPTAIKDQMDATMRPVEEEVQSAGRITPEKRQRLITKQAEALMASEMILPKKRQKISLFLTRENMRKEVYIYIITSLLPTKTEPPPPPINQPPPCCRRWRRDSDLDLHLLHLGQDPLLLKKLTPPNMR